MKFNPFTGTFDFTGSGSGGGTPGGSDTQIQFNDGGAFGGSSYAVFNKTTGLVTLSPPAITVAAPSGLTITLEEDASYGYATDTDTWNAKVYAYKIDPVSGNKIFSSTAATTTDVVYGGRDNYRINFSWTAASGADGYRILVYTDKAGLTYNYDHYIDKATNGYIDNNDQTYIFGSTVTPSSPQNAYALKTVGGHLSIGGNIGASGSLEVLGGSGTGVDSNPIYYHETITDYTKANTTGLFTDLTLNHSAAIAGNVYGNHNKITVPGTATGSIALLYGNFVDITAQKGVSSLIGEFVSISYTSSDNISQLFGAQYSVTKSSTGTIASMAGIRLTAVVGNSGNITTVRGADIQMVMLPGGSTFTTADGGYFLASLTAAATVTNMAAGHFDVNVTAGTAITSLYGVKIDWALSGVTPTNGYGVYVPTISGATNSYAIFTNTGKIRLGDKITTYNAIATAGWGVPSIYGSGRSAAQTAAVASIAAYTVGASDGSFEVSANVNVTTATTHNFTVTCAYTDETNTARTLTLGFTQLTGATFLTAITNVTGAGPYESPVYHIRCKASTAITIATTGTFTTVTYNVEGIIKQTA
jgi:hypothetical protein